MNNWLDLLNKKAGDILQLDSGPVTTINNLEKGDK